MLNKSIIPSGEQLPIDIRPANVNDIPFILNTWMKSHRDSAECRDIEYVAYHEHMRQTVVDILNRANVIMAVNPDDADQIYGYLCVEYVDEITLLHYGYVKYTYRKLQVFKQLAASMIPQFGVRPLIVTFTNRAFADKKEKFNMSYNPYLRVHR